ncbi:MAG: flagellar hook-associated protein FlgK [Bacteroidota bacterium]
MSIQNLYRLGQHSFGVFSAQMNIAGQNIANAATPGYSRRRLTLATIGPPGRGPQFGSSFPTVGVGVSAERLERMRDGLLVSAADDARTRFGGADEEARLLGAVEGLFGVGSGASLQDTMGDFWNAWSDLAGNPTDTGVRTSLLSQAETVAGTLNDLDSNLNRLAGETQTALGESVGEVNGLLDEIAALNTQIRAAQAAGSPDLAAEDRRDAAVAALSAYVPVSVSEESDGYAVTIDGMIAVQGDQALGLTLDTAPGEPASVRFEGTTVAFSASDGKVGAQLRTLNETIPGTRDALNSFTEALVTEVNAKHAAGFGLDGSTGLNFFDPAGLTAGSIQLSSDLDDPAKIAASGVLGELGNSDVALALAKLREGFDQQVVDLVSGVGTQLRAAQTAANGHASVVSHLDAMARGVSGVSIDEEMTYLLEAQQAFAAAARIINTAEEMMDTLLAL